MKMKRTIYADRDGMVSQLQNQQMQARANAMMTSLPKYRRQFWEGKAEGLQSAIRMLQDWAGENEPETGE
jgi:hypothetical protein